MKISNTAAIIFVLIILVSLFSAVYSVYGIVAGYTLTRILVSGLVGIPGAYTLCYVVIGLFRRWYSK